MAIQPNYGNSTHDNFHTGRLKLTSDVARSTGGLMNLAACPRQDRAPLIHWMAERMSEKVSLLPSQDIIEP